MPHVLLRFFGVALCLGTLAGGLVPGPAVAQKAGAGTFEIAVVDVQKILREAAASRTIRPQLAKLKKEYRARFKKMEEVLRAANQDLNRQRAILSPEAYKVQRKAFRKRASETQREVQAAQRQLDGSLATAMRKIHRTLQRITAKFAEDKGIKLILPKSSVLLMETRFDITEEILKRLNEQLPSLTIKVPPAPAGGSKGKDGKK